MNRSWYKSLLLLLILLLPACTVVPSPVVTTPTSVPDMTNQDVVRSSKVRAEAPLVPAADQETQAAGNTAFAFDLYHTLDFANGNLFLSPYSISLALAMTYGGARGATETQMAQALHFNLSQAGLHPAFNALDQELAARKSDTGQGQGTDGKGFRLNIVNDIWGQRGYPFQQDYLDLLAENYGAGLRLMDFKANPEQARQQINDYIAQQTEQRIPDLVPPGVIDPLTRLVLTNAIYFNAAWQFPFDLQLTEDAPFTLLDGTEVQTPMMRLPGAENLSYTKGQGFQALELPYENDDLAMVVLLPDEGQYESFEKGLDAQQLDSILQGMQTQHLILHMPSFKFDFRVYPQPAAPGPRHDGCFLGEFGEFLWHGWRA